MAGQGTGIIFARLDGDLLPFKEGTLTVNFGGAERTPVMVNGQIFFTEATTPGVVSGTLLHTSATEIEKLQAKTAATITLETDSGKTFRMNNAFYSGPPELSAGEGDLTVEFTGSPIPKAI